MARNEKQTRKQIIDHRLADAGWQLTRETAEELFAIGGPSAGAPAQAPPP